MNKSKFYIPILMLLAVVTIVVAEPRYWPVFRDETGKMIGVDSSNRIAGANGALAVFTATIDPSTDSVLLRSIASVTPPCSVLIQCDQEWGRGVATTTRSSMFSSARVAASGTSGAFGIDISTTTFDLGITAVSATGTVSVEVIPR